MRTPEQKARDREISKRYRAKHSAKIKARRKAAYAANAEANRAASRAYYTEHKEHAAALARKYRAEKPHVFRARKRKGTYGLTPDDFRELWNLQAGRCAICLCRLHDDGERQTHVDHDHTTGAVRGLLCVDCNVGLGRFKDNAQALERASAYVALGRLTPHTVFSNGSDGR
jgi:hypothetical protein